jgi:two-component system, OmpR family, sensor histidine kinase BaeS
MQLKIAHQLTLMLIVAVMFAVIFVGGIVIWNLEGGFADYTRERDERQLQRFAGLVSEHAKEDPEFKTLQGSFGAMRDLIDEFYRREGLSLKDNRRFAFGPTTNLFNLDNVAPVDEPFGFAQRVQILNFSEVLIAGKLHNQSLTGNNSFLSQSIKFEGKTIGSVRLITIAVPGIKDAHFLWRQYFGLLGAAIIAVAAAGICASVIARRWALPLRALQLATDKMAQGSFDIKIVPTNGAYEISLLIVNVEAMAKALRRMENDRRQWIAQLSHEIRTPLTILSGEIESIKDGVRKPDVALFENLEHEVNQIARLVNDLHMLAMADLGALPLKCTLVRLSFVLNEMIERVVRNQKSLDVEIIFESLQIFLEPESIKEQMVFWDCGRIEQVVCNLVSNSVRYTDPPGCCRISWKICPSLRVVELVVEDSGPGVLPNKLEQIFEPLFRGDESRPWIVATKDELGSGLGLAIVKAIVLAHGGKVFAAQSPWGGLAVTVQLPMDTNYSESVHDKC